MAPSPDDRFALLVGRSSTHGWLPEDEEPEEDPAPRSRPVPAKLAVLAVLGVVLAGIVAFVVLAPTEEPADLPAGEPVAASSTAESGPAAATSAPVEITVHVVGAVARPAVVRLPHGSRVADALTAAGGPTDDADTSAINLARVLTDGEQIIVPAHGENPPGAAPAAPAAPPAVPPTPGAPPAGPGPGPPGQALVNINTADAAGLDTLPGVGPATAEAIITHRTENGPFAAVDDLIDVPGIGDATLARLRDLVTV
ncbi:ComEA family DNA-binding protein [Brevibacterium sp. CS2]|uniref:ComEA family DNA-binding protein n=1 Tax=Brevibacterium sp. CS2 TaxID=2575923 RepID=UPI0010C774AA|nr:ComEA family DNA-binding protein [Brevibacterium sp. CS2]QCP05939.1 ComEA family DNA-binding protein [Brevibacterium sp. CS2]